ncbi:hypothetical protein STEG23_007444 [Scotinomys teguina]
MARKAGQRKEEEESRARQQEEKTPVRDGEKTPACDGRGHHVVEPVPPSHPYFVFPLVVDLVITVIVWLALGNRTQSWKLKNCEYGGNKRLHTNQRKPLSYTAKDLDSNLMI